MRTTQTSGTKEVTPAQIRAARAEAETLLREHGALMERMRLCPAISAASAVMIITAEDDDTEPTPVSSRGALDGVAPILLTLVSGIVTRLPPIVGQDLVGTLAMILSAAEDRPQPN